MKRQPARLPSARHSSSSAEVWWISSTPAYRAGDETVSNSGARSRCHDHDVPRRRLRRGFALSVHDPNLERRLQDGPSRSTGSRAFPGAVPATIPNPARRARRRMSSPSPGCRVSISRLIASSGFAGARVGAITTTRPVAGSAARKRWDRGKEVVREISHGPQYRLAEEGEMLHRRLRSC